MAGEAKMNPYRFKQYTYIDYNQGQMGINYVCFALDKYPQLSPKCEKELLKCVINWKSKWFLELNLPHIEFSDDFQVNAKIIQI